VNAWTDFCEALKAAGAVLERPGSPADPLDQAEGVRYLARLTRLALEKFLEHADPAAPTFYRLSSETAKIGCDNPDNFYQNAAIDGRYEYQLSGTRGTVSYLGFGTYYGTYGKPGRSGGSGYLEAKDLAIAPDGRFEIVLSQRRQQGNWLPMEPDSSMLIVRQTFLDRANELPADLRIERLDAPGVSAPLTPARVSDALRDVGLFVRGTAAMFADWAEGFAKRPNQLLPLDPEIQQAAHGDPNIFFYMGYWQLTPDQALVVEAMPPPCEYWNFQVNNHWMESLDYRFHKIHINKHTCANRSDGSFRLVLAHEDPGVENWLTTDRHARGTMGLRWVKASSHPQPTTRVVKLADLRRGA
jgi:hypothetical protein